MRNTSAPLGSTWHERKEIITRFSSYSKHLFVTEKKELENVGICSRRFLLRQQRSQTTTRHTVHKSRSVRRIIVRKLSMPSECHGTTEKRVLFITECPESYVLLWLTTSTKNNHTFAFLCTFLSCTLPYLQVRKHCAPRRNERASPEVCKGT